MKHILCAEVWVEKVIGNAFLGKYTRVWVDRDGHHYEGCYQYTITENEAKRMFCYEINRTYKE